MVNKTGTVMGTLLQGLSLLTDLQKRELDAAGISKQLRAEWKAQRRLPTEAQAVIFAGIAGLDLVQLQAEIALARASEAQRPLVERYLKRVHGALATLAYGLSAGAALAVPAGDYARLCIDRRRFDRGEGDRRLSH